MRALVSKLSLLLLTVISLSACASTQVATTQTGQPIYDPLENINRATFAVNKGIDTVLLDPLTETYRFVVPAGPRAGVSNVLSNLKSPVYLANEVLQGDFADAWIVLKRFLINSFTGFGGILDTASWEGIDYIPEDFGQTLATWGVGSGPYVILPIMGPSTFRDSTGFVVDSLMDPLTWVLNDAEQDALMYQRTGLTVLSTKDQIMDVMNDLYENSLDPYAAVRSVYFQRREALINDLDPNAPTAQSTQLDDFDSLD